MTRPRFPTRALASAMALVVLHWGLARRLSASDALVALTRGHGALTTGLLALLLTVRLALLFAVPSWVAYRIVQWAFRR